MIHHVSGDILLTRAQAMAHGISPDDHFDAGLALSIRQDWPAMQKDFRHFLHTSHPKPGGLWVWTGTDGRRIVSLFTQEPGGPGHGRPGRATCQNVNHCLRELCKFIENEHIRSLAVPRIATGIGGLSWEQVEPLIMTHLGSLPIPVYLYSTYRKGVAAGEPAA